MLSTKLIENVFLSLIIQNVEWWFQNEKMGFSSMTNSSESFWGGWALRLHLQPCQLENPLLLRLLLICSRILGFLLRWGVAQRNSSTKLSYARALMLIGPFSSAFVVIVCFASRFFRPHLQVNIDFDWRKGSRRWRCWFLCNIFFNSSRGGHTDYFRFFFDRCVAFLLMQRVEYWSEALLLLARHRKLLYPGCDWFTNRSLKRSGSTHNSSSSSTNSKAHLLSVRGLSCHQGLLLLLSCRIILLLSDRRGLLLHGAFASAREVAWSGLVLDPSFIVAPGGSVVHVEALLATSCRHHMLWLAWLRNGRSLRLRGCSSMLSLLTHQVTPIVQLHRCDWAMMATWMHVVGCSGVNLLLMRLHVMMQAQVVM